MGDDHIKFHREIKILGVVAQEILSLDNLTKQGVEMTEETARQLLEKIEDVYNAIPDKTTGNAQTTRCYLQGMMDGVCMLRNKLCRDKESVSTNPGPQPGY